VALAEVAVVFAGRAVDKLYAADPYWLAAGYAEPWRSAAVSAVVVLSFAIAVVAARARRPFSWPRFFATLAAMASGVAICVESTTAVHFNEALGELYVHTLLFRRSKVSFARGDGQCLSADFDSPFVWSVNGISIHPRLLPLPYESSQLVRRISSASRGCAARS
jgi:hypothetical protein